MENEDIFLNYVFISRKEYFNGIRALDAIDTVSEILDHAPEKQIPNLIRMILGKKVNE